MTFDQQALSAWIGKTETHCDVVTPVPARALAATLDLEDFDAVAGSPLPPAWSWLYFLPVHRQSSVGPDGHPQRGGFLPPVTQPRRMWAGSKLQFHQPLCIGEPISRLSRIDAINYKEGRSGALVFVRVVHETSGPRGLAITEAQDLVYRDHPKPGEPAPPATPAPTDAAWSREVKPDPVLLFRYSALTFNGHRIHYDLPYATGVEGYPGLVVQGPLTASLLLDLCARELGPDALASFAFRARTPAFAGDALHLVGRRESNEITLAALGHDGRTIISATATTRS